MRMTLTGFVGAVFSSLRPSVTREADPGSVMGETLEMSVLAVGEPIARCAQVRAALAKTLRQPVPVRTVRVISELTVTITHFVQDRLSAESDCNRQCEEVDLLWRSTA
jgi:hypothetical protein